MLVAKSTDAGARTAPLEGGGGQAGQQVLMIEWWPATQEWWQRDCSLHWGVLPRAVYELH